MKRTIKDFDLNNKKVIIRCDFNVPINNGIIEDDNRIIQSIPTIKYATENNAKVILMSHLGRVKTQEDKHNKSLKQVANRLSELMGLNINFIEETRGNILEEAISNMKNKDIILIENTRFEDIDNKKESNNDEELGKYWASLGDIFINDAFGTAHRSNASNVGIASNLPNGVGFLIEKELEILQPAISNPKKPFTVILGGSKVSDKIKVVENLCNKADYILIGGGMANTFLKAEGFNMGASKVEYKSSPEEKKQLNYIDFCKRIIDEHPKKILLPIDVVTNNEFIDSPGTIKNINELDEDDWAMDIGPKTIKIFEKYISKSKQIIWNGPVGVTDFTNYTNGTKKLCEIISNVDGVTIIGGGDSAAAAISLGYKDKFTHISTGGGASLELLEGKDLPGIKIIEEI